jgi:hypothetical protein
LTLRVQSADVLAKEASSPRRVYDACAQPVDVHRGARGSALARGSCHAACHGCLETGRMRESRGGARGFLETLAMALHDTGELGQAAKYAALAARARPDEESMARRAERYAAEAANK